MRIGMDDAGGHGPGMARHRLDREPPGNRRFPALDALDNTQAQPLRPLPRRSANVPMSDVSSRRRLLSYPSQNSGSASTDGGAPTRAAGDLAHQHPVAAFRV